MKAMSPAPDGERSVIDALSEALQVQIRVGNRTRTVGADIDIVAAELPGDRHNDPIAARAAILSAIMFGRSTTFEADAAQGTLKRLTVTVEPCSWARTPRHLAALREVGL